MFAIIVLLFGVTTLHAHVLHPHGVTIGIREDSHPVLSQYHAQDVLGQYSYGYATPTASKTETKTADGVTQGGYSYIDADGHLQSVSYIADAVHGFRVAASNLPQDLPDVAIAKAQHLHDYVAIKAAHAQNIHFVQQDLPEVARARAEHLAAVQAAHQLTVQLPQPVQDLPEVIKARAEHLAHVENVKARDAAAAIHLSPLHYHYPTVVAQPFVYHPLIGAHQSQYHAQDGWGHYSYGYISPLSSKQEEKGIDGVTRGGYSYIDANGILQTVHYVADDVNGFRVAATNLPH